MRVTVELARNTWLSSRRDFINSKLDPNTRSTLPRSGTKFALRLVKFETVEQAKGLFVFFLPLDGMLDQFFHFAAHAVQWYSSLEAHQSKKKVVDKGDHAKENVEKKPQRTAKKAEEVEKESEKRQMPRVHGSFIEKI